MRAHDPSVQHPSGLPTEPDAGPADDRPNRAARRGKHASSVRSRGRGAAPDVRGA